MGVGDGKTHVELEQGRMDEKEKRKGKRNGGGLGIYRLGILQNFPIGEGRWRQATACCAGGNVTTPGGSEMDIVLLSSLISGSTVELEQGLKLKLKILIYGRRHVFLRSRLKGRGHFTLCNALELFDIWSAAQGSKKSQPSILLIRTNKQDTTSSSELVFLSWDVEWLLGSSPSDQISNIPQSNSPTDSDKSHIPTRKCHVWWYRRSVYFQRYWDIKREERRRVWLTMKMRG